MMRITGLFIVLFAFAQMQWALAAITPRQDFSSDCAQPPVQRSLRFIQGSSQDLGWTFTQGTTAKDLTGATLVTFVYSPTSRAWSQVVTGAVDVATNGTVLVTFTPAQLNTNSTSTGTLDWLLEVTDGANANLAFAYGKLTLIPDPSSGVTNTFPTTTTTVDWSTVAAYTGSAVYGPVRPGTGLTASTNADGSLTFAAAWAAGDTGTSNGVVAWVTAQGYGTGNLSQATADTLYDALGSAAAASNGALSVAASTYLPLAGGTMAGNIAMGANLDIEGVGYDKSAAIKFSASHLYLTPGTNNLGITGLVVLGTLPYDLGLGYQFRGTATGWESTGGLDVGGAISEGGTSLSAKYAPKTQTWPMDCNTTLLPTNVVPWVVTSWGPFDQDVTLTKLYAKVMFGSETAIVHVCEMATNAATYTTNNSITADVNGVYDTTFSDAILGAGNTLFFMLDGTGYSPLASNINVHIDGTRQYVNP